MSQSGAGLTGLVSVLFSIPDSAALLHQPLGPGRQEGPRPGAHHGPRAGRGGRYRPTSQGSVLRYHCTQILYSDTYCTQVIKAYTLIVSFMPAISALSGNLGLQASANTIRGLGTGERM